jgi:hypothetical protein
MMLSIVIIFGILLYSMKYRNTAQESKNSAPTYKKPQTMISPYNSRYVVYAVSPKVYFGAEGYQNFLETEPLGEVFFTDVGVEEYNWTEHHLTLNSYATTQILSSPLPSYFIVTLDKKRIYGGIILPRTSPRTEKYPILRYSFDTINEEKRLVIDIEKPTITDGPDSDYRTNSGIKSVFEALGSLVEIRKPTM